MRASNYARLKVAGKLTWRTLGTKLLSVAQHELSELLKDQERISEVANSGESWKLVDDAIDSVRICRPFDGFGESPLFVFLSVEVDGGNPKPEIRRLRISAVSAPRTRLRASIDASSVRQPRSNLKIKKKSATLRKRRMRVTLVRMVKS